MSNFGAYGVSIVIMALISAMFAYALAGVYWRSGSLVGLLTMGTLSVASAVLVGSELTLPVFLLALVLIHAVERRWSLSKAIWSAFAVNAAVTTVWMSVVLVALSAEPSVAASAAEVDAMLAEIGLDPWIVAAVPGLLLAGYFISAWLAVALVSGSREDLWPRRAVQDWQVPWLLVWVLIVCGFGAVGVFEGLIHDRDDGVLRTLFMSGAVLAGSWFLVQGFLVAVVAIQTLRLPVWLAVLGIFLMGNALPLVGVAEIWGGFREKLRQIAEAREKAHRDGGRGSGPGRNDGF